MYLPWENWGCKHSDHFYRAYFSPRSTLRRLLQLNWAIPWSWNPFPCLGYIYFLSHSVTSPVPLYIVASWMMFSLGPGERIFFLPHAHMLLSHVHKDVWKVCVHTCFDSASFLCLLLPFPLAYDNVIKYFLFPLSEGEASLMSGQHLYPHVHPETVYAMGTLKVCLVNCWKALLTQR